MFDITGKTLKPITEARSSAELEHWWAVLVEEGRASKATESLQRSLSSTEIEGLARRVFEEVQIRAVDAGVNLPPEYILRLISDLSGMGPLLELIARADIEDIAINLGHIYVYTTTNGWEHVGPAPDGIGDALRVMIDRAGQRAPTPDYPVADAMLQVMVPLLDGMVRRKGVRINYIMPQASPYGDTITLRISNYRTASDLTQGSLAMLCQKRLPPVPWPRFDPKDFPRGDGILTPEAANYLLSVMVHGGTLVIAGTTGSGKTFVGQRILQERLDYLSPWCHPSVHRGRQQ
jgi:Flp pilus assembly CpaF family ATPase